MHEAKPKPAPKGKPKFLAVIDEEICSGCDICIEFCPVDCIREVDGPDFARVNAVCRVIPEECIGCKICARECPWDAIEMIDLRPKAAGQQAQEGPGNLEREPGR